MEPRASLQQNDAVAGPSGSKEPGPTQGTKRPFGDIDDEGRLASEHPKKKLFRQPNAFQLQLPPGFDFEALVLGKDGADWELIQRKYIRDDVSFTWGYKEGVPDMSITPSEDIAKNHMDSIGYVLMVGRAGLATTSDDTNVLTTWRIITRWWSLCCQSSPKPIKFVFYDYAMNARRIAMNAHRIVSQAAEEGLPPGLEGSMRRVVSDRRLCTAQVKEILDKGGDNIGDSLEEWLVTTSTATCLSRNDRIELANFEWYVHANKNDDEPQGFRAEQWRMAMLAKFANYPELGSDDSSLWW
ncbi:hypothetical protein NW768_004062 [Fusarium equiseti]|uniref:Uncharacterized protein n=1 Tax=Fusarium equiseti TaxID=61235 RepID=A0ABQ8RJC6_FUSEQ|nr:hypothetical protein NW768_004062 [Fusarium equiseti]